MVPASRLTAQRAHTMKGAYHGFTTTEEQHSKPQPHHRQRGREGWHDHRPDHP